MERRKEVDVLDGPVVSLKLDNDVDGEREEERDGTLPPLPPDTKPLSHQVAGHVYGKSSSKFGMLECKDGTILKPLPAGCCGRRELSFYECIWGKKETTRENTSNKVGDVKPHGSSSVCNISKKKTSTITAPVGCTNCTTLPWCKCTNHILLMPQELEQLQSNPNTARDHREAYLCHKYKQILSDFDGDYISLVGRFREESGVRSGLEERCCRLVGVADGDLHATNPRPPLEALEVCKVLEMARQLTPTYLGTYIDPASPGVTYLRQDDVTHGFRRPCIADVKIGKQSYDPEASTEKILKELNKYPPQQKLCFQLKGMRHYSRETDRFATCSKEYLRTLDENSVLHEGFARFFNNGDGLRHDVVTTCVQKLDAIIDWVSLQRLFAFYASSILIVYEGARMEQDLECFSHGKQKQESSSPAENSELARGPAELITNDITRGKDKRERSNCIRSSCYCCGSSRLGKDQSSSAGEVTTVNNDDGGGGGQNIVCMHQCVAGENWSCQQCREKLGDASGPSDPEARGPGCGEPTNGRDEWVDQRAARRNQSPDCKIEVKMIDFARVFPTAELDRNYLEGLKSLKLHLMKLLEF